MEEFIGIAIFGFAAFGVGVVFSAAVHKLTASAEARIKALELQVEALLKKV